MPKYYLELAQLKVNSAMSMLQNQKSSPRSYCSAQIYCVTDGTGNYKLIFGKGSKLIVETSKYLDFIYLKD